MLNIPVALALQQSLFTLPVAIHIKNALAVVGELALFIKTYVSQALEVCTAHIPNYSIIKKWVTPDFDR